MPCIVGQAVLSAWLQMRQSWEKKLYTSWERHLQRDLESMKKWGKKEAHEGQQRQMPSAASGKE